MLSYSQFLNEGLIKVSTKNLSDIKKWASTFIINIIVTINKNNKKEFLDIISLPKGTFKENMSFVLDTNSFIGDVKIKPATIKIKFAKLKPETNGHFIFDDNGITVNIEQLKTISNNIKKKFSQKKDSMKSDILFDFNYIVNNIMATIEHEITHAIQFNVLKKLHIAQVDDNRYPLLTLPKKRKKAYFTSAVEFDPQIKTAISDFNQYIKVMEKVGIDINKSNSIKIIVDAKKPKNSFSGLQPSDFFKILKKEAPTRWKKAVKIFTSNII